MTFWSVYYLSFLEVESVWISSHTQNQVWCSPIMNSRETFSWTLVFTPTPCRETVVSVALYLGTGDAVVKCHYPHPSQTTWPQDLGSPPSKENWLHAAATVSCQAEPIETQRKLWPFHLQDWARAGTQHSFCWKQKGRIRRPSQDVTTLVLRGHFTSKRRLWCLKFSLTNPIMNRMWLGKTPAPMLGPTELWLGGNFVYRKVLRGTTSIP